MCARERVAQSVEHMTFKDQVMVKDTNDINKYLSIEPISKRLVS